MTTPDDTRERLAKTLHDSVCPGGANCRDDRSTWTIFYKGTDDLLAALRDSGWVDPGEAANLRTELARQQDIALTEAIQRDALLPVVEAAKVLLEAWDGASFVDPEDWQIAAGYMSMISVQDGHAVEAAFDRLKAALGPESQAPTVHDYLSTGCLHGEHDYCRCDVGRTGPKTPGQCKFCAAPCRCGCHAESREGEAVRTMHIPGDSIKRATEAAIDAELARRGSREESTDGR